MAERGDRPSGRGPGDGGDAPAWSRKRPPYEPPPPSGGAPAPVPYAELHCHSNFSFLDGASPPEELAEEAARLGLSALALTDHDGLYGLVRFAEAAEALGLPIVVGAELTLGATRPQNGVADPEGRHLVVLARSRAGYARLCRAISRAQLAGEKGAPRLELADLAGDGGEWQVLTGCRKGTVPAALAERGPPGAERALAELVEVFGRERVAVELWDHGLPTDSARNDALARLAARRGVATVATNNVHYATPRRRPLATALAAVRARRSLDDLDGWLPPSGAAHLRSGAEQARRFARYPGAVERAAALGRALAFDLKLVAPRLPPFPVPPVHTEATWLRELVKHGARRRYGPPERERVPGAYAQLARELDVIDALGYAGYFLVVWDLVEFCRRADVYCQGRGSAANSAVCYALGVTNADAVALGLVFERFLSAERDGPPDIDLDVESDRRDEVIAYVYDRYGRDYAAQVANVVTYRPRSAVRDLAKALGHSPGAADAWSKQLDAREPLPAPGGDATAGPGGRPGGDVDVPAAVLALAKEAQGFPRHLGLHSGGMVLCDRPVVEVCPVEWARHPGRSVLQWDKDDCAAAGLVKFDLLGLGMLSALHHGVDLIARHHGVDVDLATLPQDDPAVYDMLCAADTVGVFQVESRAQMATLPRLRPRTFYDLVVEVALIRPGPIQGGSVHPYLRRRNGDEPVTYPHPLLERALERTLGVPLFQEQLMQVATDAAGFSGAEADRLRQAMGSKRSAERMARLRARLYEGMAARGITGAVADEVFDQLSAFASYGFPESHSASFAYLVYASAWMKRHYPAAFCAALLNAQPLGFYAPSTLVADARRHGVVVRGPDANASAAAATLEPEPRSAGGVAVRLGIASVRDVGDALAEAVAAGRPYRDMEDLRRRTGAPLPALEALAVAGAFGASFGLSRREALWAAGAVAQASPARLGGPSSLEGIVTGADAPALPAMTPAEEVAADAWATGVPAVHPVAFARPALDARGALPAAALRTAAPGSRVLVAGVVTHRQRPETAKGTTFVNLEDETGMANVVCPPAVWAASRRVARSAPALVVRGRLERAEGVVNVVAERLEPLSVDTPARSRDFR